MQAILNIGLDGVPVEGESYTNGVRNPPLAEKAVAVVQALPPLPNAFASLHESGRYGREWYRGEPHPGLGGVAVYTAEQVREAQRAALTHRQQCVVGQAGDKLWCETCEGSGKVYQEHQHGCHVGGEFPCPDCDGNGYWARRAAPPAQPQSEPMNGWKLVPVEPTAKMLAAAWPAYIAEANRSRNGYDFEPDDGYRAQWSAMLAAAPPLAVEPMQALTESDICKLADDKFPDWRIDIQQRFVVEMIRAYEAARGIGKQEGT